MKFLNFDEHTIPLDTWIQNGVDWLVTNYRDLFQFLNVPIEKVLKGLNWLFAFLPPIVVITLMVLAAWRYAGKRVAVFTALALLLIGYMGLWEDTMITL